jgi:hypothetical protein
MKRINLVEQTEYNSKGNVKGIYTYSYDLDKKGNWIRQKKMQEWKHDRQYRERTLNTIKIFRSLIVCLIFLVINAMLRYLIFKKSKCRSNKNVIAVFL